MQDSLEATDCFKWKYQAIVCQVRMSWICDSFNFFAIYINFCHLRFCYDRNLITFILFKFLVKLNMELFKFISKIAILVCKIKLVVPTCREDLLSITSHCHIQFQNVARTNITNQTFNARIFFEVQTCVCFLHILSKIFLDSLWFNGE